MIARQTSLVLPGYRHRQLEAHLYPGDGREAAALLLCAVASGRREKLLVQDIITVPYEQCSRRTRDSLTWPGEIVESAIDRAAEAGLAIICAHSHPGGLFAFSPVDDGSDKLLMPSIRAGTDRPSGSAIMIPGGAMRARLYRGNAAEPIDVVMRHGDEITCWWEHEATAAGPAGLPMAFTSGMTQWLGRLSAVVIGVSGTGSIVAEQLARLGFGEIILIDDDKIEPRNLNRILNSTTADANKGVIKVDMCADAIRRYRPDCDLVPVPLSIGERDAVLEACEADMIFSCVDTAEGRHLADRLAAYFAMPLFDVGVAIPTRATPTGPAIAEVCGRIDYVQPGGSTLGDRGVYTAAMLEAEYLARVAPDIHAERIREGYIRGVQEQAPAVIPLNMRAASALVMEFIARMFPFRHGSNAEHARTIFMLADGDEERTAEATFRRAHAYPVAAGATEPLLGLPLLAPPRTVAA